MPISLPTIKRLFGTASNRCAFPDCDVPLIEEDGTVTAEICHIHAARNNGPRPNKALTDAERHGFGNLLLMCSRHHTIVDAKESTYTVETLREFKKKQVSAGIAEISPRMAAAAKVLYDRYIISISNNSGNVAVNSPGAIQAHNVILKTQKNKVVVGPTPGSIASDLLKRSYVEYLIKGYQDCQKADTVKEGRLKYMVIHNAIRHEFAGKWEFVPMERFEDLVALLKKRIDSTILGRVQGAKGKKLYHSFVEHIAKAGDVAN